MVAEGLEYIKYIAELIDRKGAKPEANYQENISLYLNSIKQEFE